MEYHIDATPRYTRYIESLLPEMFKQLGLNRSRKFLHIKVDAELEDAQGTCVPLLGIDTFLVVLKPNRNLADFGITLAHELTHVSQFAKGILKVTPKGNKWKGKFYGRGVAYLQQPWEVQAFQNQELIFRRVIEQIG
jgi:hypothetical protein